MMPTQIVARAILQIVDDAIATNDPLLYEQLLRALQMWVRGATVQKVGFGV